MKTSKIAYMVETVRHPGFRDRFREAVQESSIKPTQAAMGKAFGCSDVGARHWWQGEKLPGMDSAIRIAKKTGVCVEWLLTGRGPKRPISDDVAQYAEALHVAPLEVREKVTAYLEVSNLVHLTPEEHRAVSLYNNLSRAIDELEADGYVVDKDDIDSVMKEYEKYKKATVQEIKNTLKKAG